MLLHNSESSANETAAVRLYLDESGGSDPGTPHAVVAGMVINYSHFVHFEEVWDAMLVKHGITAPLHMKDFAKERRFGAMSPHCKRELFCEVAGLISSHRIASLEAQLTNKDYETYFPKEAREKFGVYGSCFNLAVVMNHKLAEGKYDGRIPFILDAGNPYAEHVRKAHKAILQYQRDVGFLHAGGLYFDDDALFGVLQAADVIAWGARRRAAGLRFPPGYEPILEVITEGGHNEAAWTPELLKELGANIMRKLAEEKLGDNGHNAKDEF
jgi:hypothetical protein